MSTELLEQTSPSSQLPSTSASEMKKQGWRSVMATVRRQGHLLVTNHNTAEAVILSPEDYDRLVAAAERGMAQMNPKLEALSKRFDERLKSLEAPDIRERMQQAMRSPITAADKVTAGSSY